MRWTVGECHAERPSIVFRSMFVDGTPDEVSAQVQRLKQGESVMDTVLGEAKDFQRTLGRLDREKFDEYFTSVREVEVRMLSAAASATGHARRA